MMDLPDIDVFGITHDYQVGFECGAIWAMMLHADDEVKDGASFVCHIQNAELLLYLADAIQYTIQSTELDEHMMQVVFKKNEA